MYQIIYMSLLKQNADEDDLVSRNVYNKRIVVHIFNDIVSFSGFLILTVICRELRKVKK